MSVRAAGPAGGASYVSGGMGTGTAATEAAGQAGAAAGVHGFEAFTPVQPGAAAGKRPSSAAQVGTEHLVQGFSWYRWRLPQTVVVLPIRQVSQSQSQCCNLCKPRQVLPELHMAAAAWCLPRLAGGHCRCLQTGIKMSCSWWCCPHVVMFQLADINARPPAGSPALKAPLDAASHTLSCGPLTESLLMVYRGCSPSRSTALLQPRCGASRLNSSTSTLLQRCQCIMAPALYPSSSLPPGQTTSSLAPLQPTSSLPPGGPTSSRLLVPHINRRGCLLLSQAAGVGQLRLGCSSLRRLGGMTPAHQTQERLQGMVQMGRQLRQQRRRGMHTPQEQSLGGAEARPSST